MITDTPRVHVISYHIFSSSSRKRLEILPRAGTPEPEASKERACVSGFRDDDMEQEQGWVIFFTDGKPDWMKCPYN